MTITTTNIANQTLIALGELVITDLDTDTTKRGTTLAALYEIKKKYLLRNFPWKFAIKRATLAEVEYKLLFDTETVDFVIGEVLSGAVGEGTVEYIVRDGTAGIYYLSDVTTGFVDDEAITGDIAGVAVANGVEVSMTPINDYDNVFALPSDYVHLLEVNPTYVDYKVESNFILCSVADELDIKYIYNVTDPDEFDPMFTEAFAALLARESAIQITDSMSKRKAMDEAFLDKLADARFSGSIEDPGDKLEADEWLNSRI